MKKIVFIFICFFAFILNIYAVSIDSNVSLKSCIDGDTANFNVNGEEVKVRFLAVNAPEKDTEEYGKDASDYVCSRLVNANIILLEYDEKATVDKYDRTLAWVWVDGELLEQSLVFGGYAEVAYIYDDYKYTNSLCKYQSEAIKNKSKIWANGREEDYCASVDTSHVENNISFENLINNIDKKDFSEEEYTSLKGKFSKFTNTINSIADGPKNGGSFIAENRDLISKILLFLVLGGAGIYILVQYTKEK